MQAVKVFPAQERVELGDVEPPSMAEDDDVLLRVLEVGACGTDREICAFSYGTPPVESDYLVLGHERLAEVVEVGPGVSRVAVGDLVVPMVRRPCAHPDCPPCRDQRQDFCMTGEFDSERYLNVVPAALRDIGVLAEPLTIAEKARAQVHDVQDRLPWGDGPHRAVVLGAGPVGLLGTMMLVDAGYDTTVYSLLPKPNPGAAMAEALGCEYVSSQEVTPAELARGIGRIDLVYEGAGALGIAFELIAELGANGAFDARWPDQVRALITGRYPLSEHRKLLFGKAGGIKNVFALA